METKRNNDYMFNTVLGLVNDHWFINYVFGFCSYFETEFNEEFSEELIDKSEIIYDSIIN